MQLERIVIAEILRPRGLKGELVARSQSDIANRFQALEANVQLKDGSDVPVIVETAWEHKGDWVLKFAGVDSVEAADLFRGSDLWVQPTSRARLGENEYYRSDLIGCCIVDARTAAEIGTVEGWQQYGGAAPLMEVRTGNHLHLVPFVAANCQVDLEKRVIRTELPEGLLDL